jgi:Xaa-Pro aminopeptidase
MVAAAPAAIGKVLPSEYAARRARLLAEVGAPVILFGYGGEFFGINGRDRMVPETTFRQEENFYYLTGHRQEGAALLLIPQTEEARAANLPQETLFLPPRNKRRERWDGARLGPDDGEVSERTGIARVRPFAALRSNLERPAEIFSSLYTLFPFPGPDAEHSPAGRRLVWLKTALPDTRLQDVRAALGRMRQVKSKSEQELLRVDEYEIASLMEHTFERAGCERPGYAPIVGSGFNSTVLHHVSNRRQMKAGEVVVIDVGAECAGYTADITRTLPVSGRFSERQREIYEIVLGAQEAVLAAVKPGMTLAANGENSLYRIAHDYIDSQGKDGSGQLLGQSFIHGLGHHIGLQVHDAGDPARPLAPGMIVTIEPGIYLPEENLGVRIEDIVLVTEEGAELLTASLPRAVEEIEAAMAARNVPEPDAQSPEQCEGKGTPSKSQGRRPGSKH